MNWRWVEEGDGYVGRLHRLQPHGQPLGVGLQCLVPYPYRRVDMQAVFSLQRSGLSHPPALLLPLGRRDYVNVADGYVVHHGCTAFRFRFAHSQQVHFAILFHRVSRCSEAGYVWTILPVYVEFSYRYSLNYNNHNLI